MKRTIEAGQSFGRLTAVEAVDSEHWKFQCSCGGFKEIRKYRVLDGGTRSCGCLRRQMRAKNNTVHGWSKTDTYRTWKGMHGRCYQPSVDRFPRYGGRGIRVCDRWHTFENFLADMGPRPSKKHSLDRKDCDADYSPDNCRWATALTQARNKSTNRKVTAFGVTLCLTEWQGITGVDRRKISDRLNRGWSPERSLSP